MDIQEFTEAVKTQFINGDEMKLTPDTAFRDNESFDSLTGMAILVMIQDNFDYKMGVDDFLECITSADLYNFIQKAK